MGNLGVPELLVILLIALLVFGGQRLPEIARSMGQAVKEFKKGVEGDGSVKQDAPPMDPGKTPSART